MSSCLFNTLILDRVTRFLTLPEMSKFRGTCKTLHSKLPDPTTIPIRVVVHWDRFVQDPDYPPPARLCNVYIGWFPDGTCSPRVGCDKCVPSPTEKVTIFPIKTRRDEAGEEREQRYVLTYPLMQIEYIETCQLIHDDEQVACLNSYDFGSYQITKCTRLVGRSGSCPLQPAIRGSIICQRDRFYTDDITITAGQICTHCGQGCKGPEHIVIMLKYLLINLRYIFTCEDISELVCRIQ